MNMESESIVEEAEKQDCFTPERPGTKEGRTSPESPSTGSERATCSFPTRRVSPVLPNDFTDASSSSKTPHAQASSDSADSFMTESGDGRLPDAAGGDKMAGRQGSDRETPPGGNWKGKGSASIPPPAPSLTSPGETYVPGGETILRSPAGSPCRCGTDQVCPLCHPGGPGPSCGPAEETGGVDSDESEEDANESPSTCVAPRTAADALSAENVPCVSVDVDEAAVSPATPAQLTPMASHAAAVEPSESPSASSASSAGGEDEEEGFAQLSERPAAASGEGERESHEGDGGGAGRERGPSSVVSGEGEGEGDGSEDSSSVYPARPFSAPPTLLGDPSGAYCEGDVYSEAADIEMDPAADAVTSSSAHQHHLHQHPAGGRLEDSLSLSGLPPPRPQTTPVSPCGAATLQRPHGHSRGASTGGGTGPVRMASSELRAAAGRGNLGAGGDDMAADSSSNSKVHGDDFTEAADAATLSHSTGLGVSASWDNPPLSLNLSPSPSPTASPSRSGGGGGEMKEGDAGVRVHENVEAGGDHGSRKREEEEEEDEEVEGAVSSGDAVALSVVAGDETETAGGGSASPVSRIGGIGKGMGGRKSVDDLHIHVHGPVGDGGDGVGDDHGGEVSVVGEEGREKDSPRAVSDPSESSTRRIVHIHAALSGCCPTSSGGGATGAGFTGGRGGGESFDVRMGVHGGTEGGETGGDLYGQCETGTHTCRRLSSSKSGSPPSGVEDADGEGTRRHCESARIQSQSSLAFGTVPFPPMSPPVGAGQDSVAPSSQSPAATPQEDLAASGGVTGLVLSLDSSSRGHLGDEDERGERDEEGDDTPYGTDAEAPPISASPVLARGHRKRQQLQRNAQPPQQLQGAGLGVQQLPPPSFSALSVPNFQSLATEGDRAAAPDQQPAADPISLAASAPLLSALARSAGVEIGTPGEGGLSGVTILGGDRMMMNEEFKKWLNSCPIQYSLLPSSSSHASSSANPSPSPSPSPTPPPPQQHEAAAGGLPNLGGSMDSVAASLRQSGQLNQLSLGHPAGLLAAAGQTHQSVSLPTPTAAAMPSGSSQQPAASAPSAAALPSFFHPQAQGVAPSVAASHQQHQIMALLQNPVLGAQSLFPFNLASLYPQYAASPSASSPTGRPHSLFNPQPDNFAQQAAASSPYDSVPSLRLSSFASSPIPPLDPQAPHAAPSAAYVGGLQAGGDTTDLSSSVYGGGAVSSLPSPQGSRGFVSSSQVPRGTARLAAAVADGLRSQTPTPPPMPVPSQSPNGARGAASADEGLLPLPPDAEARRSKVGSLQRPLALGAAAGTASISVPAGGAGADACEYLEEDAERPASSLSLPAQLDTTVRSGSRGGIGMRGRGGRGAGAESAGEGGGAGGDDPDGLGGVASLERPASAMLVGVSTSGAAAGEGRSKRKKRGRREREKERERERERELKEGTWSGAGAAAAPATEEKEKEKGIAGGEKEKSVRGNKEKEKESKIGKASGEKQEKPSRQPTPKQQQQQQRDQPSPSGTADLAHSSASGLMPRQSHLNHHHAQRAAREGQAREAARDIINSLAAQSPPLSTALELESGSLTGGFAEGEREERDKEKDIPGAPAAAVTSSRSAPTSTAPRNSTDSAPPPETGHHRDGAGGAPCDTATTEVVDVSGRSSAFHNGGRSSPLTDAPPDRRSPAPPLNAEALAEGLKQREQTSISHPKSQNLIPPSHQQPSAIGGKEVAEEKGMLQQRGPGQSAQTTTGGANLRVNTPSDATSGCITPDVSSNAQASQPSPSGANATKDEDRDGRLQSGGGRRGGRQTPAGGAGHTARTPSPGMPGDLTAGLFGVAAGGIGARSDTAAEIAEVRGRVLELARVQNGSRNLQRYLMKGHPEMVQLILSEAEEDVANLMTDAYGNYLCQQLFQACSLKQRRRMLQRLAPQVTQIACNKRGTHALQSLIGLLSTSEEEKLLVEEIKLKVVDLSLDQNGTHVVQRVLVCFSPDSTTALFDPIVQKLGEVAVSPHGLCVVKRCIGIARTDQQKQSILRELVGHAMDLVQNPYGNYAVQHALENWGGEYCRPLFEQFRGKLLQLAVQKFSSNVVEKCFEYAEPDIRSTFVEELTQSERMPVLIQSSYGQYVAQKALDVSSEGQIRALAKAIAANLKALGSKKMRSKWEKILLSAKERLPEGAEEDDQAPSRGPSPAVTLPPNANSERDQRQPGGGLSASSAVDISVSLSQASSSRPGGLSSSLNQKQEQQQQNLLSRSDQQQGEVSEPWRLGHLEGTTPVPPLQGAHGTSHRPDPLDAVDRGQIPRDSLPDSLYHLSSSSQTQQFRSAGDSRTPYDEGVANDPGAQVGSSRNATGHPAIDAFPSGRGSSRQQQQQQQNWQQQRQGKEAPKAPPGFHSHASPQMYASGGAGGAASSSPGFSPMQGGAWLNAAEGGRRQAHGGRERDQNFSRGVVDESPRPPRTVERSNRGSEGTPMSAQGLVGGQKGPQGHLSGPSSSSSAFIRQGGQGGGRSNARGVDGLGDPLVAGSPPLLVSSSGSRPAHRASQRGDQHESWVVGSRSQQPPPPPPPDGRGGGGGGRPSGSGLHSSSRGRGSPGVFRNHQQQQQQGRGQQMWGDVGSVEGSPPGTGVPLQLQGGPGMWRNPGGGQGRGGRGQQPLRSPDEGEGNLFSRQADLSPAAEGGRDVDLSMLFRGGGDGSGSGRHAAGATADKEFMLLRQFQKFMTLMGEVTPPSNNNPQGGQAADFPFAFLQQLHEQNPRLFKQLVEEVRGGRGDVDQQLTLGPSPSSSRGQRRGDGGGYAARHDGRNRETHPGDDIPLTVIQQSRGDGEVGRGGRDVGLSLSLSHAGGGFVSKNSSSQNHSRGSRGVMSQSMGGIPFGPEEKLRDAHLRGWGDGPSLEQQQQQQAASSSQASGGNRGGHQRRGQQQQQMHNPPHSHAAVQPLSLPCPGGDSSPLMPSPVGPFGVSPVPYQRGGRQGQHGQAVQETEGMGWEGRVPPFPLGGGGDEGGDSSHRHRRGKGGMPDSRHRQQPYHQPRDSFGPLGDESADFGFNWRQALQSPGDPQSRPSPQPPVPGEPSAFFSGGFPHGSGWSDNPAESLQGSPAFVKEFLAVSGSSGLGPIGFGLGGGPSTPDGFGSNHGGNSGGQTNDALASPVTQQQQGQRGGQGGMWGAIRSNKSGSGGGAGGALLASPPSTGPPPPGVGGHGNAGGEDDTQQGGRSRDNRSASGGLNGGSSRSSRQQQQQGGNIPPPLPHSNRIPISSNNYST